MRSFVIVDNHPLICSGVVAELSKVYPEADYTTMTDGQEAKQVLTKRDFDFYIFDIEISERVSGFDLLAQVKSQDKSKKVTLLTLYKDKAFVLKALELDVDGYLNKDAVSQEIVACIQAIEVGQQYLGKTIFDTEEDDLSSYLEDINKVKTKFSMLTQTEKTILKLISEGKSSQEISDLLFSSPKTIQNHRYNMCKKLEISGHNSLVKWTAEYKSVISAISN